MWTPLLACPESDDRPFGAIVALAFKRTAPILDGNVRRALTPGFTQKKGERGAPKNQKTTLVSCRRQHPGPNKLTFILKLLWI
ncbi:MAG: hypothetical protein CM1200mP9_05410 [Gammaproteobacteria bacterium]|nr:MAG: hypothetical protein CM1200mP9_05410 [Gammaproteobacteria bacterium]